jgi:hypothetical protein
MTPVSRHPTDSLANYPAPLAPAVSGGEFGRDLAIAWAELAAWRDTAEVAHHITVLRPFVIPVARI